MSSDSDLPIASASVLALLIGITCAAFTVMLGRQIDRPAQAAAARPPAGAFRVCADPNNLPFSNAGREGFENMLAGLIAADRRQPLEYTWWPQRRGFVRTTLAAGLCDVVMGVPVSYELTLNTKPYYESTYMFVTRRDRRLRVRSFDDPRLRQMAIGVHVVGDDYASVPPAAALAARHIVGNVRGYGVYGNYARPNPAADLIAAVARGEVDIAIAWGPLAGYFASRSTVPMTLSPVAAGPDRGMRFKVAIGVRRDSTALRDELDAWLSRHQRQVDAVLTRFHVPTVTPSVLPHRIEE
jgi:mxaJ protein